MILIPRQQKQTLFSGAGHSGSDVLVATIWQHRFIWIDAAAGCRATTVHARP